MAKSPRLAIVPKKSAAANDQPAPQKTAPDLPESVWHVLFEIQNRLFQVRGVFASAYALAETNDDSSDVRYAMEAALQLFDSVIDSVDPVCVKRAAAERGES